MSGRVLLTGATGFVGRHAVGPLLARGFEVHAATRGTAATPADGVRWHAGVDLLDPGAGAALVRRVAPTHLLHFAWFVEHGAFWQSPENLRWVGASLDLLRAFAESGGRRAVISGTCAEYEWGGGECDERLTPERPATLYGASKLALTRMADAYGRVAGVSFATGRLFLLYGPHETPRRLVPSVVRALLDGEEARCTHGRQLRDFLHVADAADAFVALLASDVEGPVNIASGAPVRLRDVVTTIAEEIGRPDLVRLGAVTPPAGDPDALTANVARLRDEVGWRPRVELRQGLADTIRWWADAQSGAARGVA